LSAAGLGLALLALKPADLPDPALLARLEQWKALAPEVARSHRLHRRKGSD
jgi:hypothetical protein